MPSIRPTWVSFGGTAAIVTSMGLILGLDAAETTRRTIVSALLIIAVADNLSDSLSVHIYQEAEKLDSREAFASTLANFATRLAFALSFVALVSLLPREIMRLAVLCWGFVLLTLLTAWIARERGASVLHEVTKHVVVGASVVVVSRWLGSWIAAELV